MNESFSQNKWKYLSFGLMGVIAVGLLMPQANGATKEIHQQIIDILNLIKPNTDKIPTVDANVAAIKARTENLPIDPASQLAVDNGRLTYVVSEVIGSNLNGRHFGICTSDKPFVVNLVIKSVGSPELTVSYDPDIGGNFSGQVWDLPGGHTTNLVFPRNAGDILGLAPFANGQDFAIVHIFMQTQPDATASCSVS